MAALAKVNALLRMMVNNSDADEKIQEDDEEEMKVTEQGVSGKVDYTKLCAQFGCDLLTQDMIAQMQQLTGQRVHPMIRRQLYYAHRDFDKILAWHAAGKPWYLYTGRGPSSDSMHS